MSENIKELIDKIQQEGINLAEEKARAIEKEATNKAKAIIEEAMVKAENITKKAKEDATSIKNNTASLLKQTSRDVLLSLRKEINILLNKIITLDVNKALSAEELQKILFELIKNTSEAESKDLVVTVSPADLEKLRKHFHNKLSDHLQRNITLKSSNDISAGFVISYDKDKSHFDFSDKALADYIGNYLKPKLRDIL
jgi:V/A-type H+-transporting ATPase subunit E